MNLRRTEKHEPLAPLRRLEVKAKPFLPVNGEVFPLTSPFIERGYRRSGVLVRDLSGYATYRDLSVHGCATVADSASRPTKVVHLANATSSLDNPRGFSHCPCEFDAAIA